MTGGEFGAFWSGEARGMAIYAMKYSVRPRRYGNVLLEDYAMDIAVASD